MFNRKSVVRGMASVALAASFTFPVAAQAAVNDSTGDIDQTIQVTEENHRAVGWTAYEFGEANVDFTGRSVGSPMGNDSAEMLIGDEGRGIALLHLNQYACTRLSDIGNVSYWTNVQSSHANRSSGEEAAPYAYLSIDQDRDGDVDDVIVYEPTFNGNVVQNTWQQWDADQGRWHSARNTELFTLAEYQARFPDATLVADDPAARPEIYLNLSNVDNWENFVGNTEGFAIELETVGGDIARTYDFEDPGVETALNEVEFGNDAAFDER